MVTCDICTSSQVEVLDVAAGLEDHPEALVVKTRAVRQVQVCQGQTFRQALSQFATTAGL